MMNSPQFFSVKSLTLDVADLAIVTLLQKRGNEKPVTFFLIRCRGDSRVRFSTEWLLVTQDGNQRKTDAVCLL